MQVSSARALVHRLPRHPGAPVRYQRVPCTASLGFVDLRQTFRSMTVLACVAQSRAEKLTAGLAMQQESAPCTVCGL
jgi:hypothetical protein